MPLLCLVPEQYLSSPYTSVATRDTDLPLSAVPEHEDSVSLGRANDPFQRVTGIIAGQDEEHDREIIIGIIVLLGVVRV